MRLIYDIFIQLYTMGIRVAAFYNPKAKLWVAGRVGVLERLEAKIKSGLQEGEELIWFHCASLGEFEQGRPLMEKFKVQSSKFKVLLTFFSPSGYEVQKNYPGADFIFYLPADTSSNAKRFLERLPIKAAFFVKYEFWFNYLHELKKKNIPTYLVSGIFRADQYFFKPYGGWARKQLRAFTHFFLQDEGSGALLKNAGFINYTISGDTRFDRVSEIAENKKEFPLVKLFAQNAKVIVAGSTYQEDERLLMGCGLGKGGGKLILAPHEIDAHHMEQVTELFKSSANGLCVLYSKATELNMLDAHILIIDNIGMLSSLYQYGQLAYIGGGFNEGIHNILEASAFGLPTIFGPDYRRNAEALDLVGLGGAFTINNAPELQSIVNKLLGDTGVLMKASEVSKKYVSEKRGATEKILEKLL